MGCKLRHKLILFTLLFGLQLQGVSQVLPQFFPHFAYSADSAFAPLQAGSMLPHVGGFHVKAAFAGTERHAGKWFNRKLLHESFFIIKDSASKFTMTIDPLLNAYMGQDVRVDNPDRNLYQNTRAFVVRGTVGSRFGFESFFFENQSFHPLYQDLYIRQFGVVPGQGRTKAFKQTGFDYAQAYGNMSFKVADWLLIRAGSGKHFFGDGYRSLLWSDNTFSYPFLQFSSKLFNNKLSANWIHASLQDLTRIPDNSEREGLFIRKNASLMYLEYSPKENIRLSIFESVMWQRWDSLNVQPFNAKQLIPLPLFNSLTEGFLSENHALLGINAAWRPLDDLTLFGQLAADNSTSDRLGYQLGFKWKNVGIKGVNIHAEYNVAGQDLYSSEFLFQYHGHYNQPLAHPMGNNFEELVVALYLNPGRFRFLARNHFVVKGNGFSNVVDRNHVFLESSSVYFLETRMGYLINPVTNLELFVGARVRNGNDIPQVNQNTAQVFFGLSSRLFNYYYDF
ncbi:MAG: hypothetical protein ACXITV_08875 [Luteibaculaceae bacterium]